MVIHESYVTRKPLEFTLIVLFIIFLLLLPVYFYTKKPKVEKPAFELVPETYAEVSYMFSSDSDLSDADKKQLFTRKYENKFVQWTGLLMSCTELGQLFRVSIDQTNGNFGDVIFTTEHNCTEVPDGATVTYRVRLIEWKMRSFIGKDGDIVTWE